MSDSQQLAIKLTIIFSSQREKLQMIEIIDEKRVYFASGACLIDGRARSKIPNQSKSMTSSDDSKSTSLDELGEVQQQTTPMNNQVKTDAISVSMRPARNEATELLIRVHSSPRLSQQQRVAITTESKRSLMSRVCSKSIKIAKFNMFLLIHPKLKHFLLAHTSESSKFATKTNDANEKHDRSFREPIRLDYSIRDATNGSNGGTVAMRVSGDANCS